MTGRQERFCIEYLIDQNATQAAIRSGYSKKTAVKQGSALLTNPDIRARIDEELSKIRSARIATATEVLEMLTSAMRGELHDTEFVLVGSGAQEARMVPFRGRDRNKAAELLGKALGIFSPNSPAYGAAKKADDPLTSALKEEAARLDAQ